MIISDVVIQLSSHSSVAVAVDNVTFRWVTRTRATATKKARVVERLDRTSGELSRTAAIAAELTLPCTLHQRGGDDGKWQSKVSHLHVGDADAAETEAEPLLCAVPLDLSAYATTAQQPVRRSHVELPLNDGMGSMSLAISVRLLGAAEDTVSDPPSEPAHANLRELDGFSQHAASRSDGSSSRHTEGAVAAGGGGAATAIGPAASPAASNGASAREARWQEVYELERSRADAMTIERLEGDVGALIEAKRAMQEELLRLRTTVAGLPQSRKYLAERVAELESQVSRRPHRCLGSARSPRARARRNRRVPPRARAMLTCACVRGRARSWHRRSGRRSAMRSS